MNKEEVIDHLSEHFPPEDLHPALELWKQETEFGTAIKHPLVFDIFYTPHMNHMLNKRFKAKLAARDDARQEKNWSSFVFLHERPHRLDALMEIHEEIEDDKDFWELVGGVWTDSENIWQNYAEWEELLSQERPGREFLMTDEEREKLAALPEEITIYRGYTFVEDDHDGIEGFSWTLDKQRAAWFSTRLARDHETTMVATATVSKADVIAHFLGRGEEEIVALPCSVRNIEERAA